MPNKKLSKEKREFTGWNNSQTECASEKRELITRINSKTAVFH
ncbi:hypothetical protein KIS4809_4776 [Bacillus sp. ZZV12-4809]|nr:hypothetical protein KIS4809_4776 [Bacillus sp. ZZV12-4809]